MATTFTGGSSARAPVPPTTATSPGSAGSAPGTSPEPPFTPPLVPPPRRRTGDLTEADLTAAAWSAQADGRSGHWHANVRVEAYLSAEGPGTPWLFLHGPGWRRLPRAHERAGVALAFLGAQAHRTGRPVSVLEDSEGVVRQIYLW